MKHILDLPIIGVEHPRADYVLLKLQTPTNIDLNIRPGQFVEIRVDGSDTTFLRRPISINWYDAQHRELWLLIHVVGDGTRRLSALTEGETLNIVFPLGNGFSTPSEGSKNFLLIGGGVGTAPLLYYGKCLKDMGHNVNFLLGGRSAKDVLQLDLFEQIGETFVTTEDGTLGEKGFVTQHSILSQRKFEQVATCGPKPMMKAVARWCRANNVACEASLENMMACGLGACLCCVENTRDGNVCVCKEGPVFNIDKLNWE